MLKCMHMHMLLSGLMHMLLSGLISGSIAHVLTKHLVPPFSMQVSSEAGATGAPMSTVDACSWEFSVRPVHGWGDSGATSKPTAGWLSLLAVFEPHWQVRLLGLYEARSVLGLLQLHPAASSPAAG